MSNMRGEPRCHITFTYNHLTFHENTLGKQNRVADDSSSVTGSIAAPVTPRS